MKLRLAAATVAATLAFAALPATAQAGGLHHLCPTHWVAHHMHHHHHHHAKKAVVVKKVAKKPAMKKAVAKKPLK